jgi:RNA polymerase sigma factor (TIGR02999 family)
VVDEFTTSTGRDGTSGDRLVDSVYAHLRAIAEIQLRGERRGHTLTATALVHEAFLRLRNEAHTGADNRGLVLHAAAEAMRRILIEHARSRGRIKRGGNVGRVSLDAIGDVADLATVDREGGDCILAFDEAFRRLQEQEASIAEVVRLRFYAGLTVSETAAALGVSDRTVNNYWMLARAWLARELDGIAFPGR